MVSKYAFHDYPDGSFKVSADDRRDTLVRYDATRGWLVDRDDGYVYDSEADLWEAASDFGLPAGVCWMLVSKIAYALMADWRPRRHKPGFYTKDWAITQTRGAIATRVRERWLRVMATLPPERAALERRMAGVTRKSSPLVARIDLHSNVYKDLMRYPAACWALMIAPGAAATGVATWNWTSEQRQQACLDAMAHWRDLFALADSTTGVARSYRALNQTLDQFPGSMPEFAVGHIPYIKLERAYHDRLELLATIYASRPCGVGNGDHLHVFQHRATHSQLVHAMKIVGRYLHLELNPRRHEDIRRAVGIMTDYPIACEGGVVALAERSVAFHREQERAMMEREQEWMRERYQLSDLLEGECAPPPISLPKQEGVAFLSTIRDIHREGLEQTHCMGWGNYDASSMRGETYCFSILHQGERASAAVDAYGEVQQCYGARNQTNNASRWATKVLKAWGRQFPTADQNRSELFQYQPNQYVVDDIPF